MATINKYRIFCLTDGNVHAWAETEPTTCPVNTSHTINPNLTTIVETVDSSLVVLKEETIPTQGYYRAKGFCQQITNTTPGSLTNITHTYAYRTSLLEGWFFTEPNQIGDYVEVNAGPNTVIGAIVAPVALNQTVISVSPTVIPNVAVGFNLKLSDGTNIADVGEIIAINTANQQITVSIGSTAAFSPLTPTYVLLTVKIIEGFYINAAPVKFEFARKKLGGKTVPPGVPIVITYHNDTGGAKKFCYCMEIMY
jgi:hypothetical protein